MNFLEKSASLTNFRNYPYHLKKPPGRPDKDYQAENKKMPCIHRLGHCHHYKLPADIYKDYVPDKPAPAHSITVPVDIPAAKAYLLKPGKHSLAVLAVFPVRFKDNLHSVGSDSVMRRINCFL